MFVLVQTANCKLKRYNYCTVINVRWHLWSTRLLNEVLVQLFDLSLQDTTFVMILRWLEVKFNDIMP